MFHSPYAKNPVAEREPYPPLHEPEDNPTIYLLCTALLYIICLVFPQHIGLDITFAILCALIFIARPLWGVFFIIAVHPIMMCYFDMLWLAGQSIEIVPSVVTPYTNPPFPTPSVKPFLIYPFQIASFILFPALIFHSRPYSSVNTNNRYQKILYITLSIFFIWGIITSLEARYPYIAFLGLSRFGCLIIIICYLIRFIQSAVILRKVMVAYCSVAIILSFFAYYGTYNGFRNDLVILNDYGITISVIQQLSNGTQGFIRAREGMLPGFGLSAKHEFSTFLASGFFYSIYLFISAKKRIFSAYYCITGLAILIALFYGPSKLTLAGIIIGTLLVTILNPSARRHISLIVVVLVGLIIFALTVSGFTRPPHAKRTASTSKNFKVVNDSSQFSTSLKGRIAKMSKAAKHIKSSHGLGIGSGMLEYDPVFSDVHGHNFFITLFAENGLPAIICVFIMGGVLTNKVSPVITSRKTIPLAVVAITASLFAIFFEYSFDCFIWSPQLWITGSLLWIAVKNKEDTILFTGDKKAVKNTMMGRKMP